MGLQWTQNKIFQYFQKSFHGTFVIFCVRLQWCKYLKFTSIFSSRLLPQKRQKKWCRMGFFKFCEKSASGIFSDFLHEVTAMESLKIYLNDFLGIIQFWGFWTKSGQIGPKWGFSSFVKNRYFLYFLFFCMRLQTDWELKSNWIFFLGKKICGEVFGPEEANMCVKRGVSSFVNNEYMEIF